MDARAVCVDTIPPHRFVEREQAVPYEERTVVPMAIILADDKDAALPHGRVIREDAVHDLSERKCAKRVPHAAGTKLRAVAGENAIRDGTETCTTLVVEK
ncbi:hypothetical protein RCJ22_05320, partial [Vibrio sp. FNV 38]|nr:hypothetical protein [Vibrio sp. FNV 38]